MEGDKRLVQQIVLWNPKVFHNIRPADLTTVHSATPVFRARLLILATF